MQRRWGYSGSGAIQSMRTATDRLSGLVHLLEAELGVQGEGEKQRVIYTCLRVQPFKTATLIAIVRLEQFLRPASQLVEILPIRSTARRDLAQRNIKVLYLDDSRREWFARQVRDGHSISTVLDLPHGRGNLLEHGQCNTMH
jgi:hypothetical protein